MAKLATKTVKFLGNDVVIRIPNRSTMLVSKDGYYSKRFDLGNDFVLNVFVQVERNLNCNHITVSISTKDDIDISRYDTSAVSNADLTTILKSEIDKAVGNIQYDISNAYDEAVKYADNLNKVAQKIQNRLERNISSGGV